jgi:lysozyme family protein
MKFEQAVEEVVDVEGTVSNDPNDPGKLTKWGISEVWYPEVRNPLFSRSRAIEIYRADFWLRFHCDQMPDGVDLIVFDAAVNQTQQCARMLQRAVNAKADGEIGPETLKAVNALPASATIREFGARRAIAYSSNPLVSRDGLGWFRRLMKMVALATAQTTKGDTSHAQA